MNHFNLSNNRRGIGSDEQFPKVVNDQLVTAVWTERGSNDLRELGDGFDVSEDGFFEAGHGLEVRGKGGEGRYV